MRKSFLCLTFLLVTVASAQSLRPSHWLMDEVRYFWSRGLLWEASPSQAPLELGRVGDSLAVYLTQGAPGWHLLKQATLEPEAGLIWIESQNGMEREDYQSLYHAGHRAGAGLRLSRSLLLYGSFFIDNQLDADSSYIGERQSGYAAYMEQAYLLGEWRGFSIKFGRDFLRWGYGLDATLHLSDWARPLDHLFLAWENRLLQLSYFTATLDQTNYPLKGEPSVQHRYLSGHRIELKLRRYLRLSASETALFGGPNAGVDFAFANPVLFYTGVEQNGPQKANVMASFDAALLLSQRWMFYGAFLVDDFQFESSSVDDRGEPAEVGLHGGWNWADPLQIKGLDLYGEYTRITNRTYNGQGGPWEKYMHRGRSLGHFLGNDFDRLIFGSRYRYSSRLRMQLQWETRRRGEGRIEKPFDTPWRDVAEDESYAEPFPTGIVERSNRLRFFCRWQPLDWLSSSGAVSYVTVKNNQNVAGQSASDWRFWIRLTVELAKHTSIH